MRGLIIVHRWLGVFLCALVFLWFLSGIGMMYWPFPEVTAADQLARAAPLDASTIRLSPAEAAARADIDPIGADVRLRTFDGRPVYRFVDRGRLVVVRADTGDGRTAVSQPTLDRIASTWTGQPATAADVQTMTDVDQWTVQASARRLLPLIRYSWPNGEVVYLDEDTGEVAQYTTTASRLRAYLGPIPHWLYFTPLRKHPALWTAVVVWSAALATVAAMVGLVVGVARYSPARRYRVDGRPSAVPYRGSKGWHAVLGLVFGTAAATWAFSGMLSMEPFPRRGAGGDGGSGMSVADALMGAVDLAAFDARPPQEALTRLGGTPVKELALSSFRGQPMYLATLAGGRTMVVPVSGDARATFDIDAIVAALGAVGSPGRVIETRLLTRYDRYYLDRRGQRPLPVVLAIMDDENRTRVYVDPASASIVGRYSSRDWVTRWLYHGLHSLDLPWLYDHRPLWDVVVIAFMLGGAALSVTSTVLAWQVVGRTVGRAAHGSGSERPPVE